MQTIHIGTRHSGQSGRPFVISSAERPWPCSGMLHLPQAEAPRRLASDGLNETVSSTCGGYRDLIFALAETRSRAVSACDPKQMCGRSPIPSRPERWNSNQSLDLVYALSEARFEYKTGETYERNYGWGCLHGCNCHARTCAGILCLLGHGQCDRSAAARED